ncbi:response regulator transcription factor [bacterium]|nr:response regulator transcription factor [bacterium]
MAKKSIRIFIADDNCLLLEGLVSMLGEQEDFVVVGTAPNGSKALEQIKDLQPEVALIDIGMPDKDGLEVTQILHQDLPQVKVIILGLVDLTDEIMACIEAGANGYVLKESSFDHLVETIRSVHRNEAFCSPRMAASLFSRIADLTSESKIQIPVNFVKLTGRELDVISLIDEGLSNKEIAKRLFIETQTVKNHIHNILDKLQLHNRFEAVEYARERKLLKKKS